MEEAVSNSDEAMVELGMQSGETCSTFTLSSLLLSLGEEKIQQQCTFISQLGDYWKGADISIDTNFVEETDENLSFCCAPAGPLVCTTFFQKWLAPVTSVVQTTAQYTELGNGYRDGYVSKPAVDSVDLVGNFDNDDYRYYGDGETDEGDFHSSIGWLKAFGRKGSAENSQDDISAGLVSSFPFHQSNDVYRRSPVDSYVENVDPFSSPYMSLANAGLRTCEKLLWLDWISLFLLVLSAVLFLVLVVFVFVKCKVSGVVEEGRLSTNYPDHYHHQTHCHRRHWQWWMWRWRNREKETSRVPRCCCCRCCYCCSCYCCCWFLMVVMALPPNRTELLCGSLQNVIDASLSVLFWGRKGDIRAGRKKDGTVTSMKDSEERERAQFCCSEQGKVAGGDQAGNVLVVAERNETGKSSKGSSQGDSNSALIRWPATKVLDNQTDHHRQQQQHDCGGSVVSKSHHHHQPGRFRKTLSFIRAVFSRGWKWSSSSHSGTTDSGGDIDIGSQDKTTAIYRECDRCLEKKHNSKFRHHHRCLVAGKVNGKEENQFHCDCHNEQSFSSCSYSSGNISQEQQQPQVCTKLHLLKDLYLLLLLLVITYVTLLSRLVGCLNCEMSLWP